jgi:hypothetical protein
MAKTYGKPLKTVVELADGRKIEVGPIEINIEKADKSALSTLRCWSCGFYFTVEEEDLKMKRGGYPQCDGCEKKREWQPWY